MDFEAFPADEIDYQGIKKLLHQLFLREDIDTSRLTDHLIRTPDLTTVLKQVGDDDDSDDGQDADDEVYGVISLIDLNKSSKDESIVSLRKYLVQCAIRSKNVHFEQMVRSALSAKSALILNERFINLPARISLPCFEALVEDMRNKPDLELDHLFMVIKVQEPLIAAGKQSQAKRQKGENGQKTEESTCGTLFQNPEEEILCEKGVQWVQFSVANQCDDDVRSGSWDEEDVKYRPCRRILLLDKERFLAAIADLKRELSGPTA